MQIAIENQVRVAFTLGDLDTQGNLKDPLKIIRYINSYGNFSLTYPAPSSMKGSTFYGLPIKRLAECKNKN